MSEGIKIQLKRTASITDSKKKELSAGEPLVDTTNNTLTLGTGEEQSFTLGKNSISVIDANDNTKRAIKLLAPVEADSSKISLKANNGIKISGGTNSLTIENDSGSAVKFKAVTADTFTGNLAGNANSATKVNKALTVNIAKGSTGVTTYTFNGSKDTTLTIPVASSTALGLVKDGGDVTISTDGIIAVNNNSHTHTAANITDLEDIDNLKNYEPKVTLTADRAVITNSSGGLGVSTTTSTQIGYLNTATSNIQTQIDGKQPNITGAATSITSSNLDTSKILVSDGEGKVAASNVGAANLSNLTTGAGDALTPIYSNNGTPTACSFKVSDKQSNESGNTGIYNASGDPISASNFLYPIVRDKNGELCSYFPITISTTASVVEGGDLPAGTFFCLVDPLTE